VEKDTGLLFVPFLALAPLLILLVALIRAAILILPLAVLLPAGLPLSGLVLLVWHLQSPFRLWLSESDANASETRNQSRRLRSVAFARRRTPITSEIFQAGLSLHSRSSHGAAAGHR
jgi:hypothetical protein